MGARGGGQAVRGGAARTSLGLLSLRGGSSGPGKGRFPKKSPGGIPSDTCQLRSGLRSASHFRWAHSPHPWDPSPPAFSRKLTVIFTVQLQAGGIHKGEGGRLRGNGTELALHKINCLCGPSLYTHENRLASVPVSPPPHTPKGIL